MNKYMIVIKIENLKFIRSWARMLKRVKRATDRNVTEILLSITTGEPHFNENRINKEMLPIIPAFSSKIGFL